MHVCVEALIALGAQVCNSSQHCFGTYMGLSVLLQVVGYCTGLAGAIIAAVFGPQTRTHLENSHRIIGLVAFILFTIQVTAIVWRPHPGVTRLRYDLLLQTP